MHGFDRNSWFRSIDRRGPNGEIGGQALGLDAAGIIVREVSEEAAAVGSFPPEELVGEDGELVGPEELLGDEIIHAGSFVDLGKLRVVPEGVGVPTDLCVEAELFLEVALPYQDLAS